jgi:hypothetical protein
MSVDWAERQRHTNKMARKVADYLFSKKDITPRQLYGLSKLSWITNSYDGEAPAYIGSTKIPALSDIFEKDFSGYTLDTVATEISRITRDDTIGDLILNHSGFTNFYKAYRNSVYPWIEAHSSTISKLYKAAFKSGDDGDRLKLIKAIEVMPGIPKANHPDQLMKPEYFLTPVFFMLDPDIKFPLINGNKGVRELLSILDMSHSSLSDQYSAMVGLYGREIKDAADLDQIDGKDLPDFVATNKKTATKKLLEMKDTVNSNSLPLKDEDDIEVIRKSGTITQRRIHNQLTNSIMKSLSNFTLLEGRSNTCMFDVLVKKYDNHNDLMIEVKSSCEAAQIRMAVGQLFDYWFTLNGNTEPHLAILLPEQPNEDIIGFAKLLKIGVMWFNSERLCTDDQQLLRMVKGH